MVRYLLGEMSEQEKERVEEQFFLDSNYLEELQALEEELIRDYLAGQLSDRERKGMEVVYLDSPELVRRVEFSRSLMNSLSRLRSERREEQTTLRQSLLALWLQRPLLKASLATLCVIMFVAVPALLFQTIRLSGALNQSQSARAALEEKNRELERQLDEQRLRADQVREQIERERDLLEDELARLDQSQSIIASLSMSGNSVRSAEPEKLVIQSTTIRVRFELSIGNEIDYPRYAVRLKTAGGDYIPLQTSPRIKRTASGSVAIVSLAADLFTTGSYTLQLSGVSASGVEEYIDDYSFDVVKR
jgi:hypothetical protein